MKKIKPGVTLNVGGKKYKGEIPASLILEGQEKFLASDEKPLPEVETEAVVESSKKTSSKKAASAKVAD